MIPPLGRAWDPCGGFGSEQVEAVEGAREAGAGGVHQRACCAVAAGEAAGG